MALLTQEMKDMIATQQCFHATVSKDGVPNNAPKRSTRVFDDETLIFNEGVGKTTYQNLLDGSIDAVAVVNREIMDGYRFICLPEVLSGGEIYENSAVLSVKAGMPKTQGCCIASCERNIQPEARPNGWTKNSMISFTGILFSLEIT